MGSLACISLPYELYLLINEGRMFSVFKVGMDLGGILFGWN